MNGPDLTQFDASALSKASAQTKMKTGDSSRVRETAEDFEAFFVSSMLESMFAGIKTDSMFGGGHGEDVFRPLSAHRHADPAHAAPTQTGAGPPHRAPPR